MEKQTVAGSGFSPFVAYDPAKSNHCSQGTKEMTSLVKLKLWIKRKKMAAEQCLFASVFQKRKEKAQALL